MDIYSYSAIILAAGDGVRLKSSIPKAFHRVGGLSLVDHVIKSALESGIGDVRVVIRQEHEAFFHSEFKEKISMAHQASPRGTGDAVKCALGNMNPSANEFVYLLYADIPLVSKNTLQKLADVAVSCSRTAVVVLAMEAAGSNALGRLEAAETEGTIKSIVESRDASGTTTNRFLPLCNAGLLVRKDMLLNLIEQINPSPVTGEIYATDIVRLAHEAGHLCRYYTADVSELSGANTRGELAALELYFQQKMRQKHLANGVTLVAPETVFFSFDTIIENDVTIKPFVVFGRHVHIKSGSVIESFCSIDGSEVENAVIGPFGRLRQGTQINAGAHIGNFVEIKNSSIGENAKINH
ncbi:MAG: NTP transferase domain-containing protein, partial [Holosporaceae bacterium]|nr:NTP transferase domain-containing protein [Holosporaceae bacterium]